MRAMLATIGNLNRAQHRLARDVIAAFVALGTLAVAVSAASGTAADGLSVTLTTLASQATASLEALGATLPLGFAFGLGMAAAVNPCGFALLPTYLTLYLGTAAHEHLPWRTNLLTSLKVSAAMAVSFVALFSLMGAVLGAIGGVVGVWLPWLSLVTGVVLVFIGARLLTGATLALPQTERLADRFGPASRRTSLVGYAAYGVAFALSSLGCALPLFLAALGSGIALGGVAGALGQLVLYGLGMGAVVSLLTIVFGACGRGVLIRIRTISRVIQPLSALLLVLTGGYIVYYWLSAGGLFA